MKKILFTLLLATFVLAILSIATPAAGRGVSVFDAKGVAVLPANAAVQVKAEVVLAQIDDCCGDPLPECPPICPDPNSDSPMSPMTPLSPMRPKLPPSRPIRN